MFRSSPLSVGQDCHAEGSCAGGVLLGDNAVMVLARFVLKFRVLFREPFKDVLTQMLCIRLVNGKVVLCLFSGENPEGSCGVIG